MYWLHTLYCGEQLCIRYCILWHACGPRPCSGLGHESSMVMSPDPPLFVRVWLRETTWTLVSPLLSMLDKKLGDKASSTNITIFLLYPTSHRRLLLAWPWTDSIEYSVWPGIGVTCLTYLVTCSHSQTLVAEPNLACSVFQYSTSVWLLLTAVRLLDTSRLEGSVSSVREN